MAWMMRLLSFIFVFGMVGSEMVAVDANGDSFPISKVVLPPLPYEYNALEPYIDQDTLHYHHDKHHAKYVDTTVALIKGTPLEHSNLIEILRDAYGKNQNLFNNAAQSYNHAFYWKCMKPNGGGRPSGKLADLISESFGGFEKFREEFSNAGLAAFGSGWAWLVWTPSGLKIKKTIGADCPLTEKDTIPLLTMDVWEHAYYLKYKNLRVDYINNFIDKLIDWEFVASQLP